MLDKLRLTAKNSFIYSLGNISVKLTGLILIPIYTNPKYLSVTDFGILGILEITSLILISVIEMSLNSSLARWYWDTNYTGRQKSMFFTILVSILFVAIASILGFSFCSENISVLLFKTDRYSSLIKLMIVASALEVVSGTLLALLKLQQRAGLFTITNIIKLAVNLTATIVLIVHFNKSLEGIYMGLIMGNVVFLTLLVKFVLKNIKVKLEGRILIEMLNFSYPLIFASISSTLINTFDRYSLNYLSTLDNVGIYNLGFKISNTIKILLVTSVQMAVLPFLFKMMNDTGSGRFYAKYMTYFSFVTMIMVVGLSLFSQEIIQIFTNDIAYNKSYTLVPVLTMAVYFGMLKETSLTGLQIAKKTKVISIVILVVTIINLLLNVLLIPVFGIYGAASATLISQVIFFTIIYYMAQKIYYIPYELRKVLLLFLVGTVLILGTYLLSDLRLVYKVLIKIILLIAFPFILYLFNFYEEIEIQKIRGFFTKWGNLRNFVKNFRNFLSQ